MINIVLGRESWYNIDVIKKITNKLLGSTASALKVTKEIASGISPFLIVVNSSSRPTFFERNSF